jgi:CspA family cold shock protein
MEIGTVKWFDVAKGYGFIIRQEGGPDVYVHAKALERASISGLVAGTVVRFSVAARGGKASVDVIAVVDEALEQRTPKPNGPSMRPSNPLLDDEDEFEREWGLRRV